MLRLWTLSSWQTTTTLRATTSLWNCSSGYSRKSAEDRLGIEKPKKPATAFVKFVSQIRPTLTAKHPTASPTEIIKIASQHWQQLAEDVKKKISTEYTEEMKKYKKVYAEFQSSLSPDQVANIKKVQEEMLVAKEKKKLKNEYKELGRPKKPMSSYFLFCQKYKEQIKNSNLIDFQLKMKDKWYALPPNEKSSWEKEANKLKEEYRKHLTLWEEKMIRMGNTDFVRNKALMLNKKKAEKPLA